MAVQFQMHIPDPEDVAKFGGPLLVGMDFRGMTGEQARAAIAVFEKTIIRLRQVAEFEESHHGDHQAWDGGGAPGAGGRPAGDRRGPGEGADRGRGRPPVFRVT